MRRRMTVADLEDRIARGIRAGRSTLELRRVLVEFAADGGTFHVAARVLETIRRSYAATPEQDDVLLDLIDIVVGCCPPERRLWSDEVYRRRT